MNLRFVAPPQAPQRAFEDYIASAEALLALLAEEQRCLQAASHDRLVGLSREKAGLMGKLVPLAAQLRAAGVAAMPAPLRQQLIDLLSRCEGQTRINGALLEARATRVRRALAAMPGTLAGGTSYDRIGRSRVMLSAGLKGCA